MKELAAPHRADLDRGDNLAEHLTRTICATETTKKDRVFEETTRMPINRLKHIAKAAMALAVAGAISASLNDASAETIVDDAALADPKQADNWLGYGRTFNQHRFSPLDQINVDSVGKLGLAWSLPLPRDRSLVGTPLVVDGILYFTGSFSRTRAVEAKTGKLIWEYDPEAMKHAGPDRARTMWDSSRGLAYYKGKVIIATVDGRLIALDAKTGTPIWSTQTFDPKLPLHITGHPTVFRDLVLVGNGGSEQGGGRGFVTAFHVETGEQAWRFYIVPGNPADGFEDEAQEMAAKTWTGEWWKIGGGGQTWNGFTYDPEYDQILIGTGNGSPWNRKARSPGGGDNLFLCSIVALDATTGKYKWHYQTVPGETWDYNSTMDIVLADLALKEGEDKRKVLMHAPKNGFFYVIDRKDGKLLSAEPIAKITWATGIDMKTGRPIEAKGARYETEPFLIYPSAFGAHSWHAMSYNPNTGLAYIPKIELPSNWDDTAVNLKDWKKPYYDLDVAADIGLGGDIPKDAGTSSLLAWDPVNQKKAWEVQQPNFWHAGTLTTAGNLVFQGMVDGTFAAYDARDGNKLWSINVGHGISAPPITYSVDGTQYVSLLVGAGGVGYSIGGGSVMAQYGWAYGAQVRQLLTFALDESKPMPDVGKPAFVEALTPAGFTPDEKLADRGQHVYKASCVWCHSAGAVSGGYAPDLRASETFLDMEQLKKVVHDGTLAGNGMPRFENLSDEDLNALQHYVRKQALDTKQPPSN
ncbi:PQQ-dependent dehydrogenase, methanol/ethanol family [Hyphomicrobium sp.]|uniref:PQQ-dependent dehydrogenase, methanol/ethanol family n=1 Tax=Hyphomicrobium sp. TaxID=82 RepID=UPI0025C07040|nr:PQQ-dependent dehydrogenase, methanol/ethanol family [Hyphomicrobium sp.]MCC7252141.1 PQQ-dependent dehydrogenase, methanol/ethanol family [Hyphomicrobium sp.]